MTALDERYELGAALGEGGMADVVEAYDRKLDRAVAVKVLRDVRDPRAIERFLREAKHAAGFSHPNVVTVYDVGEVGGKPALVMERVDGRTLAQVLAEDGRMPVDRALAATDSILAGLDAAHQQGLVHRDVKPANVLIGRDGRVKLADFGIATALNDSGAGLTATGQMIGTPTYLSPEQVDGRRASASTDLYAVGVVLYEMLAGVPPFRADHAVGVALAHRDQPVPPLEAHRSDLPAGLIAVVDRALEKDPADRFTSAREMRVALDAARHDAQPRGHATMPVALPGPTRTLPVAPAAAEAPEPTPTPTPRAKRRVAARSRWGVPVALLGVAALVGAGIALLLSSSDPELDPNRLVSAGPLVSSEVSLPTLPATTTTTLPTTLDGLIALLVLSPDAYGERGGDVLDGLLELRDHPDPNGKKVERLAEDIEEWVADGELDATFGALALNILGVSPEGLSDENHGRGNGDD